MTRPDPALLGVLAIVALVFVRALGGEFVYDDLVLVARNPALNDPFDWRAVLGGPLYGAEQGYWRPLTTLLLAWGKALGGGGPMALHAMALALHLGAVAQAAALGRTLGLQRGAALGAALLFGVCPVVVEPVSWVAAINDPLWAFCGLAAMRAHLEWRARGATRVPWATAAWLVTGLLAKENAMSIVLLLVALDLAITAPARPSRRAIVRAYAVHATIVAVWFALRAVVLGDAGLAFAGAAAGESLDQPIARRIEILGRLAIAVLWPQDPTPFRALTWPLVLGAPEFLLPAIACAALAGLGAVALARRWQPPAFAILAFFAVALPVAARPQALGAYPIADRYLYLSVCTASIAFAWILQRIIQRGATVAVVLAVIGLIYGIDAFRRIPTWSDQQTLVATGLAHHPEDPRLELMAGQIAYQQFNATGDPRQLEVAVAHFERAERLLSSKRSADEPLARVLRADIELALAWCTLAEESSSPVPRWDHAVAAFERLTVSYPLLARAQLGLGVALASAGQMAAARGPFERAIELDPHLTEAHVNLARVLASLGDKAGAKRHLDAALAQRPDDLQARAMRARLER